MFDKKLLGLIEFESSVYNRKFISFKNKSASKNLCITILNSEGNRWIFKFNLEPGTTSLPIYYKDTSTTLKEKRMLVEIV